MTDLYARLMARETLWVRLADPSPTQHPEPFEVKPLLLFGGYWVSEHSEWAPFATVGGVIIDRRDYPMDAIDLQDWCACLIEERQP